jgi:hypothetical protein
VVESHLEFVLPAFGNAEQHSSTGLCQFSAIPHFHALPSSSCVSHMQLMHRSGRLNPLFSIAGTFARFVWVVSGFIACSGQRLEARHL